MIYGITFTDDANEDLSRLDNTVKESVINRLMWLAENAELVNHRRLTGRWAGFYRLRAGDYRALYTIDRENHRIVVEAIGHRSDVYR